MGPVSGRLARLVDAFSPWPGISLTYRQFGAELGTAVTEAAIKKWPQRKKFPADASGHECYHCFSIGGIIDECPKCNGKPWSEEFLTARQEIEGDEKDPLPF